jgi:chromosome segregation ATPase
VPIETVARPTLPPEAEKSNIRRFSIEQAQRRALENRGYYFLTLPGLSINGTIQGYYHLNPEDSISMQSEVAINIREPFLRRSNNRTYAEQVAFVEEESQRLGTEIPGVKLIIGSPADLAAVNAALSAAISRSNAWKKQERIERATQGLDKTRQQLEVRLVAEAADPKRLEQAELARQELQRRADLAIQVLEQRVESRKEELQTNSDLAKQQLEARLAAEAADLRRHQQTELARQELQRRAEHARLELEKQLSTELEKYDFDKRAQRAREELRRRTELSRQELEAGSKQARQRIDQRLFAGLEKYDFEKKAKQARDKLARKDQSVRARIEKKSAEELAKDLKDFDLFGKNFGYKSTRTRAFSGFTVVTIPGGNGFELRRWIPEGRYETLYVLPILVPAP